MVQHFLLDRNRKEVHFVKLEVLDVPRQLWERLHESTFRMEWKTKQSNLTLLVVHDNVPHIGDIV